DNAAFKEVEGVVMFELVVGEEFPGEKELFCRCRGEPALVASVMNCQDRGAILEQGVSAVDGAKEDRKQRRLPIMQVENVGNADSFGCLEHRAAEEAEAFGIVSVAVAVVA